MTPYEKIEYVKKNIREVYAISPSGPIKLQLWSVVLEEDGPVLLSRKEQRLILQKLQEENFITNIVYEEEGFSVFLEVTKRMLNEEDELRKEEEKSNEGLDDFLDETRKKLRRPKNILLLSKLKTATYNGGRAAEAYVKIVPYNAQTKDLLQLNKIYIEQKLIFRKTLYELTPHMFGPFDIFIDKFPYEDLVSIENEHDSFTWNSIRPQYHKIYSQVEALELNLSIQSKKPASNVEKRIQKIVATYQQKPSTEKQIKIVIDNNRGIHKPNASDDEVYGAYGGRFKMVKSLRNEKKTGKDLLTACNYNNMQILSQNINGFNRLFKKKLGLKKSDPTLDLIINLKNRSYDLNRERFKIEWINFG
jgi:hypothetical protein